MKSKRGVISSKKISYPYTPLEIKVDVTVEVTAEQHNITIGNPLTAFMEEEKMELVTYIPINYGDEFHWVLAFIILKERRIRVYDSISNCDLFIASHAKYLSDGLQVSNDGLDAGLLRKRYAALLWKYEEAKAQKSYTNDIKDLR
ncbi:hypothetical protein BC332_02673 [Capsicum chinense]|nr:hypothetical protein BC332_02673 [Capsicum chinense]